MLKSLVFVALFGLLLSINVPASAYDGHSNLPAISNTSFAVSYILPGRQMQKFVDAYIKNNDEALAQVRDRSSRPFQIIDSVMTHYELPVELRYLAVIESELRATALSRVGARGPWQLMAVTARDLGLKVSRRSDERTNYIKSTWAAALYLRDLHREFKDWLLVLAAYNAGPVPVYRAIRLAHSRNFWALERYLPAETRQHVRRFIATAYYFQFSGPVADPVNMAQGGGQSGFSGYYAGLHVGVGMPGISGHGGFVVDGRVVFAGLAMAGMPGVSGGDAGLAVQDSFVAGGWSGGFQGIREISLAAVRRNEAVL